tara:strand:+ start:3395 stop:3643 length:249 start_codon:yes stop_codon:yes gene_type:complete
MKLTKRQLKRIIREEYTRLKRSGKISKRPLQEMTGDDIYEYERLSREDRAIVDAEIKKLMDEGLGGMHALHDAMGRWFSGQI